MTAMIEKVAESQANFDGRKLINMPARERERYRQRARLAIEDMREPTEAMRKAWLACSPGQCHWHPMIDAAITEEPT